MIKLISTLILVLTISLSTSANNINNKGQYTQKIADLTLEVERAIDDNDFEAAFLNSNRIHALKDSIQFIENRLTLQMKQTAFDLEKERLENKIIKSQVARNNRYLTTLVIIIGLLSLVLYGAFRLWKQSKNFNQALQKKVNSQTESVKNMNEKLIQNNNELKRFSHIASHDIKEPIRNIGSFVKLIKRKIPAEQQLGVQPYFDIVNNSCNQIYTLIEDIMQYTKLGNLDKVPIELINLEDLVSNIKSNLQTFLAEKNASITTHNLETIYSNQSLLFIILKNLIENGIKYNNSKDPIVDISYVLSEYGHELHIKDNGIGISKNYRRDIFELFTRLHTRTEYEGTGLGLSIVESCLNKLGGVIQLISEIGEGSNFIIILPDQQLPLPVIPVVTKKPVFSNSGLTPIIQPTSYTHL